ncbi:response regulator [Tepidibacillus sp. HK-1]|uniref:response regulator transcription factor n=1 Tax=Tepidibacillus sp. HK-1 TaxID=1883407 RepID=UPI000853B251|nr:response regulator [Tepidibacillus sp. HK-1]GBF10361.1 HTH-type transcriptional regulator YesS [Tepidibacillus sp. HK-1]
MIKLLIVDDEQIVLDSIKYIVDKFIDQATIVGTARSGREAIEKALDLKPDAIFIDIRMPGINGIEAIRQIKAENNHVVFVIITAHEYFDYAIDAINLGVIDYLLKPLNKQKVIDVIKKIIEKVSLRKEELKQGILLKEKMNKVVPFMEGQFVYSLLINGRLAEDISFYEEMLGTKLDYGYIIVAIINGTDSLSKEENMKSHFLKQKFYDNFSMELKRECFCLVGPPQLDRIVAYIPIQDDLNNDNNKNNSINIAKKVTEKIDKIMKINYRIGVGNCYHSNHFSKSYNEAIMAATVSDEETITHYKDVVMSIDKMDDYSTNKIEQILIDSILSGNTTGTLEAFDEIYWWYSTHYKNDIDKIKSKLIELLIVLRRAIPYKIEENNTSLQNFLINLLKIDNHQELRINYMNYLKKFIIILEESRANELNGLILEAIQFIHHHYENNITLDDVAKEINMSYHYFSKFFKESTGKNFVDYLTDLRIEKSKELLKTTSISIKEIGYKVGYSDPNYFSKIFKKSTGLTPTEYRENKGSGEVISW